MKSIISFIKKVVKVVAILIIIAAVGAGIFFAVTGGYFNKGKEMIETKSEYQIKVDQKIEATASEWGEKHKVWAEQEVSKEIIAEQELKLERLREREVSL